MDIEVKEDFLVFNAKKIELNKKALIWWAHQDSNLGPADYESDALTN